MAPVHGMAAKAVARGINSRVLPGNARAPPAGLRHATSAVAGYAYSRGLLPSRGTAQTCTRAPMDSFDRGGCIPVNVSGIAAVGRGSDQRQRNFFRANGRAHHGPVAGACAKLSGLGALSGPGEMVGTRFVGQTAAFDGDQWQRAADRRLWINRTRTGAASYSIQHARMGSNAVRTRRHNVRGENSPGHGVK